MVTKLKVSKIQTPAVYSVLLSSETSPGLRDLHYECRKSHQELHHQPICVPRIKPRFVYFREINEPVSSFRFKIKFKLISRHTQSCLCKIINFELSKTLLTGCRSFSAGELVRVVIYNCQRLEFDQINLVRCGSNECPSKATEVRKRNFLFTKKTELQLRL